MVFFLLTFWTVFLTSGMHGLVHQSSTSSLGTAHNVDAPNYPRFSPSRIELEQSDLFVTQEITVTLVNPGNYELNIRGTQIDDPQWLIENLPTLPMPAQSQKKIRVVFIPKVEGRSETTLIVYTSKGEMSLDVVGYGGENIYELQPVNVRMLKGTSLGQKIRIRNYRNTHLHISTMEMRGDDIRYEWKAKEIEPGGRKTVAIVRFSSDYESGLFQARLRIETSDNEVLSIPVQISIVVDDDVHALVVAQNIDFGMITDEKEERTRELKLMHSRQEAIVVTHIEAKTPDNCLTIGDIPDQGVIVPPDQLYFVANITWCSCVNRSIFDLKGILLVYTNTTTLEVEYVGQVIIGSLYWSEENTHFHFDTSKDSPIYQNIHTRAIRLRNRFPIHIELLSASIDHEDFKLLQFDRQILEPLERYSGCRLALRWTSNIFRYDTELIIETNITQFRIPLSVFDGHFTISTSTNSNPLFEVRTLQYEKPASYDDTLAEYISKETVFWHSPSDERNDCFNCPICCSIDEGEVHATIDFGTVPRGAKVSQTLYVYNENPVPLSIELYPEIQNPYYRLFCKVLGRQKKHYKRGFGFSLAIGLSLVDDKKEDFDKELQQTYLFFKAVNQYMEHQIMRVKVQWKEVEGSLKFHPNPIVFRPSFPGVETEKISIITENLYNATLHMSNDIVSSDPRFKFEQKYDVLQPLSRVEIGTLEFDPSITEVQADYFQPPFRDYSSWNRDRGPELAELGMITERKKNWSRKRAQGKTEFSALLEVLFHNKGSVKLMASGGLQLPQLTSESLHFGNVRVGQLKESMIEIRNPFAFPIRLQLLNPVSDTVFSVNTRYKDATGVAGPYGTIALGPILFEPSWGADFVNHIYIRNNITGLESVMVTGTGKQGVLVFGDQIPDGLETDDSELILPFHAESFGVEKTEFGPQITQEYRASIVEESFYVTNSGNEAVVLENLFLVEPGDKVSKYDIGCNSLKQQNETFQGMSLLGCEGLPMTLNPNKQKMFKLKLHYFNQGPVVKSDLVAATSWGYFRTTIRFEVPLEVFSLLLSLRPKRFSFNGHYVFFFFIILVGCLLHGQIQALQAGVPVTDAVINTQNIEPAIEEKMIVHHASAPKKARQRSKSDSRKQKKISLQTSKRQAQPSPIKIVEKTKVESVSQTIKADPPKQKEVVVEEKKEKEKEKEKRSRHKSKKRKHRKKKSSKQQPPPTPPQKNATENKKVAPSQTKTISSPPTSKKHSTPKREYKKPRSESVEKGTFTEPPPISYSCEPPTLALAQDKILYSLVIDEASSPISLSFPVDEEFITVPIVKSKHDTPHPIPTSIKHSETPLVPIIEDHISPSPKMLDDPNDLARSLTTRTEDSECSTEPMANEPGVSNEGSELSTSMESMVDGSSISEFPSQILHRERKPETQTYSEICGNVSLSPQKNVDSPKEHSPFDSPWDISHRSTLPDHTHYPPRTSMLWQTRSCSPPKSESPTTKNVVEIDGFANAICSSMSNQANSGFLSPMPTFGIEASPPVVMPFIERKEESSSAIVGVRALNSPKGGPKQNPSPLPPLDRNGTGSVGIIGPRRGSFSSGTKALHGWNNSQDFRPDDGSMYGFIFRDVESLLEENQTETFDKNDINSEEDLSTRNFNDATAPTVNFPLRSTTSSFASTLFSPDWQPGLSDDREHAKQPFGSTIFAKFSELNPQAPVFTPRKDSKKPFS